MSYISANSNIEKEISHRTGFVAQAFNRLQEITSGDKGIADPCVQLSYVPHKSEKPTRRSRVSLEALRDDASVEFSKFIGNRESRTKKLADIVINNIEEVLKQR